MLRPKAPMLVPGRRSPIPRLLADGAVPGAISRDICLVDAAGKSAYGQRDIARQRTVEMCGKSELEARRQIHIPPKRKLVGAVQGVRADVFRWIVEVGRNCAEIVVPRGGDVSRERIGNLQIHVLNAGERIGHILLQAHLQSVVDRPTDGEQHLIGAQIRVNAGECRRRRANDRTRKTAAVFVSGIKAILSEVDDRSRVNIRVGCRGRAMPRRHSSQPPHRRLPLRRSQPAPRSH